MAYPASPSPTSTAPQLKRPAPILEENGGDDSVASVRRASQPFLSPTSALAQQLKRVNVGAPSTPQNHSGFDPLPSLSSVQVLPAMPKLLRPVPSGFAFGDGLPPEPLEEQKGSPKSPSSPPKKCPPAPRARRATTFTAKGNARPRTLISAARFSDSDEEEIAPREPANKELEDVKGSYVPNEAMLLHSGQVSLSDGSWGKVTQFANGGFSNIYKVAGSAPLIAGFGNEDICLRAFRGDKFDTAQAKYAALSEMRKNSTEMRVVGIEALPYLNQATMFRDGYVAVRFVPNSLVLNETTYPQVKKILADCYVYDINADAHHGTSERQYKDTNFGMIQGKPVFWDMMHSSEADEAGGSCFGPLIPVVLTSFVQGDERQTDIKNYLDPRILDVEWNADSKLTLGSPQNAQKLLHDLLEKKRALTAEVIQGEKLLETAQFAFAEEVEALKESTGFSSLLPLHNLCELKLRDRGVVTQYRKDGQVKPITNKADLANGNAAILSFLTDANIG